MKIRKQVWMVLALLAVSPVMRTMPQSQPPAAKAIFEIQSGVDVESWQANHEFVFAPKLHV